jgi:hypothetical protein
VADTESDSESVAEAVGKSSGVSRETVIRDGKYATALGKLPEVISRQIETGTIKGSEAAVIKLASCDTSTQNDVARDVRVGKAKTLQEAMQARGIIKPKADAAQPAEPSGNGAAKKPPKKTGGAGIKALDGEEAEAFDARAQVGCWADTIGRWLRDIPSIDGYRKKYPGPKGDRVVKAATELYEALKHWQKVIK